MTVRNDERAAPSEKAFALTTSRHFPEWLASVNHSLAFTTYRAGKAFFIGVNPDGKLSVFERSFSRCMGMGMGMGASDNTRSLLLTSEYQIHRLDNILPEGERGADGMALEQGEQRHVTAVSRSDTADGWRDRRANGGCVRLRRPLGDRFQDE